MSDRALERAAWALLVIGGGYLAARIIHGLIGAAL